MLPDFATPLGTRRFQARFPRPQAASFFRSVQGLWLSSIGIGTYLGAPDDATDQAYAEAVTAAFGMGVNFVDTSLNYRNQRSEFAVGKALREAVETGLIERSEIVVATKAGYLVPDAMPQEALPPLDIVGGVHSLAPAFLDDQLQRSRRNLGLQTVDVFYVHNPETQLGFVNEEEFSERMRRAFEFLEEAVEQRQIRYYGAATWEGFRRSPRSPQALSLERLAGIAYSIAGERHHFRFIQLPFNLAMPEAFASRTDGDSVLETAQRLGITAVASASLLQGRLARDFPAPIREKLAGARTPAQCAIQFTRSTPGIVVALVGMGHVGHVRENLALAAVPPIPQDQYLSLFPPA
ncbi:MAG: aldo/keto reductase [Bryobacteraceae bacterium]|jgi:aryl-alcohol dehydrogenase-like predicted oxidoreductase